MRRLDVSVCLDEALTDDFFFFFLGGGEELSTKEGRRSSRGDGAEIGADRFDGVGADCEKTTVDADAAAVDVIGAECIDGAGETGGRAESADSIKATLSLAALAFRVRAEKPRQ